MEESTFQHNIEIYRNKEAWEKKPLLQSIYSEFYKRIKQEINFSLEGEIVELGSGLGNIKMEIPEVITTDIFENPWIDRVESAYDLSFKNNSISNLIMFDVFHHLEYPLAAFKEFNRVIVKHGRVIVFDPDISLFGLLVYGILHHEPVAWKKKINDKLLSKDKLNQLGYYAAQSNAHRVFLKKKGQMFNRWQKDWTIINTYRYSDIRYVLSGGYSKPSFYKEKYLKGLQKLDHFLSFLPGIFSTRLMVVLEKK